jgi:hypothetical protein
MGFKLRVSGLIAVIIASSLFSISASKAIFLNEAMKRYLIRTNQISDIYTQSIKLVVTKDPSGVTEPPPTPPNPDTDPVTDTPPPPTLDTEVRPLCSADSDLYAVNVLLTDLKALRDKMNALLNILSAEQVDAKTTKANEVSTKMEVCVAAIKGTKVCSGPALTAQDLEQNDPSAELVVLNALSTVLDEALFVMPDHIAKLNDLITKLEQLKAQNICNFDAAVGWADLKNQVLGDYNNIAAFYSTANMNLTNFKAAYTAFKTKAIGFYGLVLSVIQAHHPQVLQALELSYDEARPMMNTQIITECRSLYGRRISALRRFARSQIPQRWTVIQLLYSLKLSIQAMP